MTEGGAAGGLGPPGSSCRVRVSIPIQLRALAGIEPEVTVGVDRAGEEGPTTRDLLDALEAEHPDLRGTIRDRATGARRAYMRYFVGTEDWSHRPPDTPLPGTVVSGEEPFRIIGAIAGG